MINKRVILIVVLLFCVVGGMFLLNTHLRGNNSTVIIEKPQHKECEKVSTPICPACPSLPVQAPTTSTSTSQIPKEIKYRKFKYRTSPYTCGIDKWQRDYANFHKKALSNPDNTTKYLVYQCKGSCCGWGDRTLGLVTSFYVAIITNRVFLIDSTFPVSLSEVLIQNKIDWVFKEELVKDKTKKNLSFMSMHLPQQQKLATSDMGIINATEDVVNMIANQRLYKFFVDNPLMLEKRKETGLDRMSNYYIFGCLFQYLFRPGKQIETIINEFLKINGVKKTTKLIGVQMRSGTDLGEEVRVKSKDFSGFDTCMNTIFKKMKTKHKDVKIFLTTDSTQFKNHAKNQFGNDLIAFEAAPVHIDFGATKEQFINTLAEYFLLSSCDIHIISRSNYGETAVMMNFNPRYKLPENTCSEDISYDNLWTMNF